MNFSNRKIFVMRHATAVNQTNVIYSNLPGFPLSELGRRQAEEAGRFLSATPLQLIISSGRERTRETAEIVAKLNSGQPKLLVDDRLKDIDLGGWAAKIGWDDWHQRRELYWDKQVRGEAGMESPITVQHRMKQVFENYLELFPTANILFVSHGDPITFLFEALEGRTLAPLKHHYGISRASVFEVRLDEGVAKIRQIFVPLTKPDNQMIHGWQTALVK